MRKHNVTGIHAVLVIVLLGFGLERAAAVTYTQITVPGSLSTQARAINNIGQIVGSYIAASETHGYLLSGGQYTTIDFPGANSTTISGINDAGDMVGFYTDSGGVTHGFLDHAGALTAIDVPKALDTIAYGINRAGQIVGFYSDQTARPADLNSAAVSTHTWMLRTRSKPSLTGSTPPEILAEPSMTRAGSTAFYCTTGATRPSTLSVRPPRALLPSTTKAMWWEASSAQKSTNCKDTQATW